MTLLIMGLFASQARANIEAYYIDRLVEQYSVAIELEEKLIEKSDHLELKREARKMMRTQRRLIRQLESWRQSYFEGVPSYLFKVNSRPKEMEQSQGSVDEIFLTLISDHLQESLKILEEVQLQSKRDFLKEFAKDDVERVKNLLKKVNNIKRSLLSH